MNALPMLFVNFCTFCPLVFFSLKEWFKVCVNEACEYLLRPVGTKELAAASMVRHPLMGLVLQQLLRLLWEVNS